MKGDQSELYVIGEEDSKEIYVEERILIPSVFGDIANHYRVRGIEIDLDLIVVRCGDDYVH